MIAYLDTLTIFDHLYIGGGNAPRINRRDLGEVLERITVVDNSAGIMGGIALWSDKHVGLRGHHGMTKTEAQAEPLAWDPLNEKYKADPHAIWKRLRDEAPLYYNEQLDFYAVSRFADVDAFSRDPKTFCSSHGTVLEMITAEKSDIEMMIFMDPPEHTRYRRLVSKAFTPRRMAELEEDIRALCARLLDEQVGKSSFDYVQDFGARVPAYVIAALLGVPPEDRDMFRGLIDATFHLDPEKGMYNDVSFEAMAKIQEYTASVLTERQTNPRDDMFTDLVERRDRRRRRRAPPPHPGAGRELRSPHRQRRHRDSGPSARLGGADARPQPGSTGRVGCRCRPHPERRRGAAALRSAVTGAESLVHRGPRGPRPDHPGPIEGRDDHRLGRTGRAGLP